jgi:hypothetical protein
MKAVEYLNKVLAEQSLSDEDEEVKAMQEERGRVEKLLTDSFEESDPTIRYGGSYKKGTMIRAHYDLDMICYFKHDDEAAGETLEDLYNNVRKALQNDYFVEEKTSALRLLSKQKVSFHIDVVPGRFTDEKNEDVYLHQTSGKKERLKTNIDKQIKHVVNSGRVDEIKLIKFWKTRRSLSLKTFVLELVVIEALKGTKETMLEKRLIALWKKLKEDINSLKIEDPANPTGNDLSSLFDSSTKLILSAEASNALSFAEAGNWENIFGPVAQQRSPQIAIPAVQAKPWSW